jgi:ABC-type amino acid transport system permease subunit
MDSTIGAAGLAVVTAVTTTLWNTGGRASLERRAIRQEIEIASDMPDGIVRRQLTASTEGRVALYVFRRVGRTRGARFHLTMLAILVVAYGIVSGIGQLIDLGPVWLEFIIGTAFLAAIVLLGLVAAVWASETWRAHMAENRQDEYRAAMQRLRQLDARDGVASDDPPEAD